MYLIIYPCFSEPYDSFNILRCVIDLNFSDLNSCCLGHIIALVLNPHINLINLDFINQDITNQDS